MIHHFDLSDFEFEKQLADHQIDPSIFNHEAHLRLAWIHINIYGVEGAVVNISRQLKSYVEFLGAQDKYNETLTIAAIRAVYHFKLKSKASNFQEFIIENPRLKNNFRELINKHYLVDVFNSTIAKQKFLAPDLLPFD